MSARTEALVLEGIAKLDDRFDRMRLDRAEELLTSLIDGLSGTPGVASIEPAGSFRRRKESIGDLDLLAETDQPVALVDAFTRFGLVDSVINRGGYKAAVRLQRGPQADLMIMPPGEAGTYRIHFTGSKEHNVKLRAMARDQGWSLSEKGFLRIGEDGEPLTGDAAELRTFGTEAEAYAFLGLPYIEPELREDTGEIEAALAGRLPALVDLADLRGDLHSHSDWSDGHHPIEVMAEAARARGYAYQVLTDHSQSLAIARGLTPDRVAEQVEVDRRAQRPVRGGGSGRHGPAGDTGRWLPAPPRLRARGARRRDARLRGRPAGALRRGRRIGPRRPAPDPCRADPAHAQCASGARTSTSSPIRPAARSASATTSTSTGTRSTRRRPERGPPSR